jgi:serine/threonine protein phosphatase PrpC
MDLSGDETMNTMLEQRYDEIPTAPTSEQRPAFPGSQASTASWVRPIRPRVEAFGLTHTGLVRATNEDAYIVRQDLGFYAVADGMGGAAAGEVAAQMAIDAVREEIEGSGALGPAHPPPLLLFAGVELANALIHAAADADPSKRGMGTTFTGMLVFGGRIAIAHVGDSRVYRLRGPSFETLMEDHSWIAAMVQAGALRPEEAATSARRHEILRAVGVEENVAIDTRLGLAEPGDVYLLSTDGLHGVVDDDAIADVLRAEPDLTRAAQRLMERALDEGGPDNVTAVMVRIGDPFSESTGEASGG